MNTLLYIGGVIAVLWIAFRVFMFVRRRVRNRRDRRPVGIQCPACGSSKLDDYSDADSGMCLACGKVWGANVPDRASD